MVGAERFELPTLCSQSRCATRLRYAPTFLLDYIAKSDRGWLPERHAVCQPPATPTPAALCRRAKSGSMLQSIGNVAAIVQWQNACLWHRMSRVRSPLAAPTYTHQGRKVPASSAAESH
jgi:hypothetical protein